MGTYSLSIADMDANGAGIYLCNVDPDSGSFGKVILARNCINPSYLAISNDNHFVYAVKETFISDEPAVVAMKVNDNGTLDTLNSQAVPGELPCHIAIAPNGKYIATAQYGSGDICIFPISKDGIILPLTCQIKHFGSSLLNTRQDSPHAHFVHFLPEAKVLAVIDLGLDKIFFYPFSDKVGLVETNAVDIVELNAGSGPRHMAFSAEYNAAYVINELNENISQLRLDKGKWQLLKNQPAFSLEKNIEGAAAALKISQDNRHGYASDRRQSHILHFTINQNDNDILCQKTISTQGYGPRDFALTPDERLIVVANQYSNSLTSFFRDKTTGELTATGHSVVIGSPVCIKFKNNV